MYQFYFFALLTVKGILGHPTSDDSRIYKGILAEKGQFPYAVFVEGPEKFCTGSAISVKTVLTTDYCISENVPAKEYQVTYDTLDYNEGSITKVKKVIPAPTGRPVHGDIGLLVIEDNFPDHVATLALPRQSTIFPEGTDAVQIGWGSISEDGARHNLLRFMPTKLLANESCFLQYEDRYFSRICLDRANGSICAGDAGGPAVIRNEDGLDVVIGIAWYIVENCYKHEYDWGYVSCRVSYYTDWILENGEGPFNVIG